MKKHWYFLLIILILNACSKKNNEHPQLNFVLINGTSYKTVNIGNQTWTAVNYNGPGGQNYNDTSVNNPAYGKLYTYAEAEAITLPDGWHLPTEDDFNKMFVSIGGNSLEITGTYLYYHAVLALMAKTDWPSGVGTDSTNFNALPAGYYGYYYPANLAFQQIGHMAVFLSSSYSIATTPLNFAIAQGDTNVALGYFGSQPTTRGSVRFVKDN